MKVEKTIENGKMTVKVAGKVDTSTAPEFERELAVEGVREIAFDLSAVEYVSSAGLRAFLNARKALGDGGRMTVAGANESVRRIFTLTGFGRIMEFEG